MGVASIRVRFPFNGGIVLWVSFHASSVVWSVKCGGNVPVVGELGDRTDW